jgi:hypothetical protein
MKSKKLGTTLLAGGFLLGVINYVITATYFFQNDDTVLAIILLLIPPAELILPWFATTALGILSIVSFALIVVGSSITPE